MLPKSLDTLRIDINSGKVRKSVAICQNDNVQRTLNFQLVSAGTPIDMSNLLFAEILIHKADGFEVDNGCVLDGDSVQYTLRTTDISAIGTNIAQLQLTFSDGQVLTTPSFEIEVYQKVLDQNVQRSSNEYNALTEQLVLVSELKNQTNTYKDAAEQAAQDASEQADIAAGFNSTYESLVDTAAGYAISASERASDADSEATLASLYLDSTSEYLASASEHASTAASKASTASNYMTSTSNYLTSTSEYTSEAGSIVDSASDLVSETIVDFDSLVSEAQDAVTSASGYANNASASAQAAADSATTAGTSEDNAKDYAERAEEAYRKMGEEGLVLGETSSTAYRGDKGKIAYDHSQTTGNPHNTTPADIGADAEGAAALAYTQAAGYIDQKIADLINGAPQTLDTLKEIADAMADDHTVIEALQAAIGSKAAEADFQGHATNSTIHITSQERTDWNAKQSTTGATDNNTVAYTSADDSTVFNSGNLGGQSTYAWNAVASMDTGEKHSSLFNKVSTMFKNVRTIAKLIGTTDISSIGNGTLSGAISTLGSNKQDKLTNPLTKSDVVNNLTTTTTNVPLSAAQGKALKDGAVASITRSGTTFTAKNAAGTSLFTFTQQDSNTTTGTNYAAGSIPNNTTFCTNGTVKNVYDKFNARTTLLAANIQGGVNGNKTLTQSMANFRNLSISLYNGSEQLSEGFTDLALFKSGGLKVRINYYDGSTVYNIVVSYVSDTMVKIQALYPSAATLGCRIVGYN